MLLAKVIGHATSTIKHPALNGWRLVLVQPVNSERQPDSDVQVAIDRLGSSPGQTVVVNGDGKAARELVGNDKSPIRFFVIGIVDEE
jgi:ethanolamine utilization protein EutN